MIDPAVLKRDKQYNRAAIGGYVLAIILTVAVGAVVLPDIGWLERRGTATYWLTMTPAAVWLIALASFSRWAIALLPFVLVGAPVSLAGLALIYLEIEGHFSCISSLSDWPPSLGWLALGG